MRNFVNGILDVQNILMLLILSLNIGLLFCVFAWSNVLQEYPISIIGALSVSIAAAGVVYGKQRENQLQIQKENHEKEIQDKEIQNNKEIEKNMFFVEKTEEFCLSLYLWRKKLNYLVTEGYDSALFEHDDNIIKKEMTNIEYNTEKRLRRERLINLEHEFNILDSKVAIYQELYTISDKDLFNDLMISVRNVWPIDFYGLISKDTQTLINDRENDLNKVTYHIGHLMTKVIKNINIKPL